MNALNALDGVRARGLWHAVTHAALTACLSLACANAAAAEDYPSRPVRMVVPNAPGSSIDTIARLVSIGLSESLGTSLVVENRAGASGIVGMEAIRSAAPDGYVIGLGSASSMSVVPLVQKAVPYDPVADFGFVSLIGLLPSVLVVNPSLPIHSVKDLIEYCRSHPGKVNMASAGPGSASHLAGAQLLLMAGVDSVHVPYKGGGPEMAALVAGETQWAVTPAPAAMALVKAGRLRAIGQSLDHRSALIGDLPAIAETLPGYDFNGWAGLVTPRGTPDAVIERLRAALVRTLGIASVREGLTAQGAEVKTDTPAEFRALVQRMLDDTARVVKAVGIKPE